MIFYFFYFHRIFLQVINECTELTFFLMGYTRIAVSRSAIQGFAFTKEKSLFFTNLKRRKMFIKETKDVHESCMPTYCETCYGRLLQIASIII